MGWNTYWVTRRHLMTLAIALVAGIAVAAPAMAQTFQDLRAQGAVGEGYDGFAHVRTGGGNVQNIVNSTNTQRRTIYQKRADEQGISPEQVGRVYAKAIFDKAPSGTWFLQQSGAWAQKP